MRLARKHAAWIPALAGITTTLLSVSCTLAHAANQDDLNKLIQLQKTQVVMHLDLSNADLRKYPFIPGKINLQQANLSHSNLSQVNLSKMDLSGANLSNSDLSGAILNEANLAGANLKNANLSGAQFKLSNLSNADMSFANLAGANLQNALLAKVNFSCSNLGGADLTHTTMTQAIISGANFTNTATTDIVDYDSVIDSNINCGA